MQRLLGIDQEDARSIVEAMRLLKVADEKAFNEIPNVDELLSDLTRFALGGEKNDN